MSFYVTFKKKTLASGSQEDRMWVTFGLLLGQVGQQVRPTFNPVINGLHIVSDEQLYSIIASYTHLISI